MGLLFQFDRIELPSISLAPIYKCLLGDSFFDQSYENSSRFMKKSRFGSIRLEKFSSLIRALIVTPQYLVPNTIEFDRDRPQPIFLYSYECFQLLITQKKASAINSKKRQIGVEASFLFSCDR